MQPRFPVLFGEQRSHPLFPEHRESTSGPLLRTHSGSPLASSRLAFSAMRAVCLIASFALLIPLSAAETSTPNTGDQIQAFQFAFSTSSLVLPIVDTCPTPLTVTKVSSTNAQISDPSAPYTLVALVHEQLYDEAGTQYERLYSASLDMGDMSAEQTIFHPWGNGTQFIACMWAANGVSGGCQVCLNIYGCLSACLCCRANVVTSLTIRTSTLLFRHILQLKRTKTNLQHAEHQMCLDPG